MTREKERLEKEITLKSDDIEIEMRRKEAVSFWYNYIILMGTNMCLGFEHE